jgi:hypothetical protein
MSTLDVNAAYPVLKEYYDSQPVRNLLERKHPFHAMVPRDENAGGFAYPQPVKFGTPTGSADFGDANTDGNSSEYARFMSEYDPSYTNARVANQSIEASRNDDGAFIRVLQDAIDGAMDNAYRRDSWMLYRTGTGSIGVAADITAGVITLSAPTDALAFQKGQVLQATNGDGGALRAGTAVVVASDISTGKISINPAAPAGWTNGDYLLSKGDHNKQVKGLGIWLPSTSTLRPVVGTPKVFEGVDRSQDPTRLAGTFLDLRSEDIEGALIELQSQVKMVGGTPDYMFVNPVSYRALQKSLQSRHIYVSTEVTGPAGITFKGIELGQCVVLEDSDCPPQTAYALEMDTWKFASFGNATKILTYDDGIIAFRDANADSVTVRVGGYRALTCSAPGWNGVALIGQ